MACFHPLRMYWKEDGDTTFNQWDKGVLDRNGFEVGCGKCFGCRSSRAAMWGVRAEHEAKTWAPYNEFIQLTVSDDYMEEVFPNWSLDYRKFQLFMKKVRNAYPNGIESLNNPDGTGVRFMAAFEYGGAGKNPCNPRLGRPHIHAALFNCYFADRKFWKKSQRGQRLYRSEELDSLWPYGQVLTGSVTYASGMYLGKYCMKRVYGEASEGFYQGLNPWTGEIVEMRPEFVRMSNRPGIGGDWFEKYGYHSIRQGFVVINGMKYQIPRYYDKRFARKDIEHAVEMDEIKAERIARAMLRAADNTPERRAVREQCAIAKAAFYDGM